MSLMPLSRRMITMMSLALVALTLSGCDSFREVFSPNSIVYPPYEGTGLNEREPTEKEKLYGRGDYSVELVRFEDLRRPRSLAATAGDDVIYEYEPDELLQGVTYKVPVLMNKYMTWRPKQQKHYKAEMQLRKLHTRVMTGRLWSGNFGRYTVEVEAHVVVRRPDSRVAVNRSYTFELQQKRTTSNGRSPSKEMDRARQYEITEDAFRRLAEAVVYDIRRLDSRRWDVSDEEGYGRVGPREDAPEQMVGKAEEDEAPVVDDAAAVEENDLPTTVEELVGPDGVEEGKDMDPEEPPMIDERPVQG
jgi:hypothetical protein